MIPADKLEPGRYLVQCKLWVEEDYLATTRLFANNNVQYYGMEDDYLNNLTPGENNTFAGYIGGLNGNFILQDMFVYVDIAEGQDLRLGIRADGRQSDGTRHPEQKNGWFKVDYFRINKVETTGISLDEGLRINDESNNRSSLISHPSSVYDLQGRKVVDNPSSLIPHPSSKPGIYIMNGKKIVVK